MALANLFFTFISKDPFAVPYSSRGKGTSLVPNAAETCIWIFGDWERAGFSARINSLKIISEGAVIAGFLDSKKYDIKPELALDYMRIPVVDEDLGIRSTYTVCASAIGLSKEPGKPAPPLYTAVPDNLAVGFCEQNSYHKTQIIEFSQLDLNLPPNNFFMIHSHTVWLTNYIPTPVYVSGSLTLL